MITAYNFQKSHQVIDEAKGITKSEMPKADFVLVGVDNEYVYFNVVAKLSQTNANEIEDIIAKTRFEPIEISTNRIYKGEFKIRINV